MIGPKVSGIHYMSMLSSMYVYTLRGRSIDYKTIFCYTSCEIEGQILTKQGCMENKVQSAHHPSTNRKLNVTEFVKRGLIHTSGYTTLKRHNFIYK